MKKCFLFFAVAALISGMLIGCVFPLAPANDAAVPRNVKAISDVTWNGEQDAAAAAQLEAVQNNSRSNASGPKIASNAGSAEFPGIFFIWDSKQKDSGYLKADASLFEYYESFVLTAKEANVYWDFLIAPQPGQVLTNDGAYVFFIPKVCDNKNINMVFVSQFSEKIIPPPPPPFFTEDDFWYNLSGNYVVFPALVPASPVNTLMNPQLGANAVKYQGIASTKNNLANPEFGSNMNSSNSNFVGNWGSNGGGITNANFVASPGANVPAAKSVQIVSGAARETCQRVPIAAGDWYYVSAWCYADSISAGMSIALAIYPSTAGAGAQALSRMNVSTSFFAKAGEWQQIKFIVQIPAELDGYTGVIEPYLDIRFRGENTSAADNWFTKAEIIKLFPDTVKAYINEYEPLPGVITDPFEAVPDPGITQEVVNAVLKPATTDTPNYSILFNLYQSYAADDQGYPGYTVPGAADRFPSAQDDFIINQVKPYLRDGDVLCVVTGNGIQPGAAITQPPANHNVNNPNYRYVDMTIVNQRLRRLRNALSDIDLVYEIYTTGKDHIQEVIAGLDPDVKAFVHGITTGYEPNYCTEFTYSGPGGIPYVEDVSAIIRAAGLKSGLAPTGRGLREPATFINWNYAQYGQLLDEMIIQTQGSLTSDSNSKNLNIPNFKAQAINALVAQNSAYPNNCVMYPQVTIAEGIGNEGTGDTGGNTNAAGLIYCVKAMEAINDAGFPGVSLWFGQSDIVLNNMLTAVKTMRTAK